MATTPEPDCARAEQICLDPQDLRRHRPDPAGADPAGEMLPEAWLDRVLAFACLMFDVPIALLRASDGTRRAVAAGSGMAATEAADAQDPGAAIRFRADAPLIAPDGKTLGALCVLSPQTREALGEADRRRLEELAAIAALGLESRDRLMRAAALANERFLIAEAIEQRICASLHLLTGVLQAQGTRSLDRRVRLAWHVAADRVNALEGVHQQLRRGGAVFGTDARAYLLALIGALQEWAADEPAGRTISLAVPETLLMASDRLANLGTVVTDLVTSALRHGRGAVSVAARQEAAAVVLSVRGEGWDFSTQRAPWPIRGRMEDRLGLGHLAGFALPGGVVFEASSPPGVTVRLAA